MLNGIFAALILSSVLVAAFDDGMGALTRASIDAARDATTLAIGLIGQMALWLGFVSVLEAAGAMGAIARAARPIMTRLFPGVPAEHPAMSAMVLNLSANVLDLGNAATPFGIKAMVELDKLNERPGVATDAMALFLAINTSGVAVLPFRVLAGRAELGADDVSGVVVPSLIATSASTLVAIATARLLAGWGRFAAERYPEGERRAPPSIPGLEAAEEEAGRSASISRPALALAAAVGLALLVALGRQAASAVGQGEGWLEIAKEISSDWLLPALMVTFVLVGLVRRVKVYEVFIEGAKGGFRVAVMIIPYLVAILVAVGMFRASGALDAVLRTVAPVAALVGMPAEVLPMALVRPLSGSGAYGVMMETMRAHGPDSFVGFAVSVMSGSTETTFYVLAVYLGAIGVRAVRYTVYACLAADATGALVAVAAARIFHG